MQHTAHDMMRHVQGVHRPWCLDWRQHREVVSVAAETSRTPVYTERDARGSHQAICVPVRNTDHRLLKVLATELVDDLGSREACLKTVNSVRLRI
jgi:hypothetical protein